MAKAKTRKSVAKPATKTAKPATKAAAKAPKAAKVKTVVDKARKLAKSPAASEIVAATLVAAAAALRDPKKARALATEAADDLKQAAKKGVDGGALWQLALDVARRSIDTIGAEGSGKGKSKGKAKPKKASAKKK